MKVKVKILGFGLFIYILFFSNLYAQSSLLSPEELAEKRKYIYLDTALQSSEKVYRLSLWFLNLDQVSPKIGQLSDLQYLELNHNQLSELVPEFKALKNLQTLKVEHNQFKVWPKEIFALKELIHLDFHKNKLEEIPSEIQTLTNLEYLDLHENAIQEVPEALFSLKKLKFLNLQGNRLSEEMKDKIRSQFPEVKVRL